MFESELYHKGAIWRIAVGDEKRMSLLGRFFAYVLKGKILLAEETFYICKEFSSAQLFRLAKLSARLWGKDNRDYAGNEAFARLQYV